MTHTKKKVRREKLEPQKFIDRQMNMILDNRKRVIYPLYIYKAGRKSVNTKKISYEDRNL